MSDALVVSIITVIVVLVVAWMVRDCARLHRKSMVELEHLADQARRISRRFERSHRGEICLVCGRDFSASERERLRCSGLFDPQNTDGYLCHACAEREETT